MSGQLESAVKSPLELQAIPFNLKDLVRIGDGVYLCQECKKKFSSLKIDSVRQHYLYKHPRKLNFPNQKPNLRPNPSVNQTGIAPKKKIRNKKKKKVIPLPNTPVQNHVPQEPPAKRAKVCEVVLLPPPTISVPVKPSVPSTIPVPVTNPVPVSMPLPPPPPTINNVQPLNFMCKEERKEVVSTIQRKLQASEVKKEVAIVVPAVVSDSALPLDQGANSNQMLKVFCDLFTLLPPTKQKQMMKGFIAATIDAYYNV